MTKFKEVEITKKFLEDYKTLNFNVYIKSKNNKMILLISANNTAPASLINFKTVYIELLDFIKFIEKREKNKIYVNLIEAEIETDEVIKKEIFNVYSISAKQISDVFNDPSNSKSLDKIENTAKKLVSIIFDNNYSIKHFFTIMSNYYSDNTHSVNVAIYSIFFGKYLNLPYDDLLKIGIASLLHDIGKTKIDNKIIYKAGVLDSLEYETIKNHSKFSYLLAMSLGIKDKEILFAILHHHEKIDGTGYPKKINNHEISLFAKILGISEVFDSLSTKHMYKDKLSTFESLIIMKKEMKDFFDPYILSQFILMFKTSFKLD